MKKKKIIESLTNEICEVLADMKNDGARSFEAEKICFSVVNQVAHNLYECLGILDEARSSYREAVTGSWEEEARSEALNENSKG